MKETDYIVIQAPMVSDLKLSGNKLIVFALIHGYCKDGVHEFNGSINYICEWTNLTRNTVIATLKSLVDDDLIRKHEYTTNNVKLCAYTLGGSAKIAPVVQSSLDLDQEGSVKNALGSAEIALGGSVKIAPNNIYTNIDNNISSEKENIIKKENSKKESSKEKSEDELFVDKIYKEYPTKCPLNNRSTNKSYKDKERIRRLMKIYSKEDILRVVIAEKEKVGKSYLRNFSTFLNNFPDPNSLFDNNTSLQIKENKDNNVLFGADYPTSVDDVQKSDIHSYPNPWYEWMYERCPKISKDARNRYNDWDKIDQNWTKFVQMCGNAKTLSYACLVLERDGYEEYYDKNGFMWMVRNFLEKNGLYNGK